MKHLRRLIWHIASRLLIVTIVLGLLVTGFYYAMNMTNIYIVLKDGMARRAQVVMMTEDVEELRKLAITILDANGNDVTDDYYVKFVGQPLRIDKRAITIRSASETKTYDGTPLTNDAVSLVFGELVEGHVLDAHATGSITFDGTVKNTIDVETLRILDAEGNDVTANYNITFEEGELTVIS